MRLYDAQIVGLGKVGINWSLERHGKRLTLLLPDVGTNIQCPTAHNRHERVLIHQPGGVGMLLLGDIIPFYQKGDKDFRRLGRWLSTIISGKQGHRMRLVVCYAVGSIASEEFGLVYQQRLRYIQFNGF